MRQHTTPFAPKPTEEPTDAACEQTDSGLTQPHPPTSAFFHICYRLSVHILGNNASMASQAAARSASSACTVPLLLRGGDAAFPTRRRQQQISQAHCVRGGTEAGRGRCTCFPSYVEGQPSAAHCLAAAINRTHGCRFENSECIGKAITPSNDASFQRLPSANSRSRLKLVRTCR